MNHQCSDHHHCNGAEDRLAQRFVCKELTDVIADHGAEDVMQCRVFDARFEHVSEASAGAQRERDCDVNRRVKPFLLGFTKISEDDGNEQEGFKTFAHDDDEGVEHGEEV